MVLLASALVLLFTFRNGLVAAAKAEPLYRRYDEEEIQVDDRKHDTEFFNFVTRPDIDAPRWEITVPDKNEPVAPGYWFVSPYGKVEQTHNDKAYVAPHIYDNEGELIWSGASLLDNYNTFTFKVSKIGGKDMLTAHHPRAGEGLIINDAYEIERSVDVGQATITTNMHEFQIVDNGTRALYLTKLRETAESNAQRVGFEGGPCEIAWNGIEERDIESGAVTFSWTSKDQIWLNESVMYEHDPVEICENGERDYAHLNAVDKLPDGDYILSGRRTDTLYKISKDGYIVWRLGGKHNEFEIDGHFSGQHDVRCLSQNSTHLILTIMDNAIGPGWPPKTNDMSRGLVLSVNTVDMTAKAIKAYDHPLESYAYERGNFQTLPNGNAVIFWTHNGLNSEHSPDGKLLRWSEMPSGLKTYRGYKFEWVGRPRAPPDVHAIALDFQNETITSIHVSWNGATEVKAWNVYQTARDGSDRTLLLSEQRTGFETSILVAGYLQYVVLEAVDHEGNSLGESKVFETHDSASETFGDPLWKIGSEATSFDEVPSWDDGVYLLVEDPTYAFLGGVLFCLAAMVSSWGVWVALRRCSRKREKTAYVALSGSEDEEDKVLDNKVSEDYDPRQVER